MKKNEVMTVERRPQGLDLEKDEDGFSLSYSGKFGFIEISSTLIGEGAKFSIDMGVYNTNHLREAISTKNKKITQE